MKTKRMQTKINRESTWVNVYKYIRDREWEREREVVIIYNANQTKSTHTRNKVQVIVEKKKSI